VTAAELIAFEHEVQSAFEAGQIRGPVHMSGGNERHLIEVFGNIRRADWVFATYRSHYHALLHGVPRDLVMAEIMAGRSMNLSFPEYRFCTSAIVGGCLSIAVGVAAAMKRSASDRRVWCFVGDMAASLGAFHEASTYARWHELPVMFVVEDNGLSCDSPTLECWGKKRGEPNTVHYQYERVFPHVGTGKYVSF
jgi:TPP-dependent pyruvate/acetoin dehydrogenase alpha subunit